MDKNSIMGLLALTLAAASCGGVSGTNQASAADRATAASCDFYRDSCDAIGPGKMYETRTSCEIDVRAKWESAWPPAECDGKIKSSELEICLSAIRATDCTAPLDILNTLANKCPKEKICSAGTNPDGG
jgi:hypothetical protein